MKKDDFPQVWRGLALPGYRNVPEPSPTYSAFKYKHLPPIPDDLDDNLDWLLQERPHAKYSLSLGSSKYTREFYRQFAALRATPGLRLPQSFIRLMQTPLLHQRVRSATGCCLELPDYVVTTTGEQPGYLLHFLSDIQGCWRWYLYVDSTGERGVLTSGELYGFLYNGGKPLERQEQVDVSKDRHICLCATSFLEFIYHFWMENEIYFNLYDTDEPLPSRQKAYAEHYAKIAE